MQVSCPICDDYTGEVSSVEAHITAATDPAHKGEDGRDHFEEMMPGEVDTGRGESASEPGEVGESVPESAPNYDCGNCGRSLPYEGGYDLDGGGKACPACGARLRWSEVDHLG